MALTLAVLALGGLVAGLMALVTGDAVTGALVGLLCVACWLDADRPKIQR
jgi:hypothetical protein